MAKDSKSKAIEKKRVNYGKEVREYLLKNGGPHTFSSVADALSSKLKTKQSEYVSQGHKFKYHSTKHPLSIAINKELEHKK